MLAIETSTLRGSIALGCGAEMLAWRPLSTERTHTSELLPTLREMLASAGLRPADVDVLAFSHGPGSFTGLRVAATIARVWQAATGCRVVAVPTFEVIARNALGWTPLPQHLAIIQDAKRGQLAAAVFAAHAGELRVIQEARRVSALPWLAAVPRPCAVGGSGVSAWETALREAELDILPEAFWQPDARQVLAVGRRLAEAGCFCAPSAIVPLYLRPPECEEVYEQRRAEARRRRGE